MHEKYLCRGDLSRKDAKAQSATAFLKGFLCAFAPLRENIFLFPRFIDANPGLQLANAFGVIDFHHFAHFCTFLQR
jgi:hypothetical protein